LLRAFAERGIAWHPESLVRRLDPERKVAVLASGAELPFDLFLGVPTHRAPRVVQESGLCVDGWIPVNSLTLETAYPNVYAVGDVTSVGTPKAGVFAEGQASIVADHLIARYRQAGSGSVYDGTGICYVEFGHELVARVEVTFKQGERPNGRFDDPSLASAADKAEFGTSRIRRWFGREWAAVEAPSVRES
jgi:sulfide:quinone oxidoreductase